MKIRTKYAIIIDNLITISNIWGGSGENSGRVFEGFKEIFSMIAEFTRQPITINAENTVKAIQVVKPQRFIFVLGQNYESLC